MTISLSRGTLCVLDDKEIFSMKEKEEWRPVLGYEDSYLVSNFGRVKSLIRKTRQPDNMMKQYYVKRKNKVTYTEDRHDYLHVTLFNREKGKSYNYWTHRLVWEAFNGKIPDELQVNHIDEVRDNNRLSNLNLMTAKENMNYGGHSARVAKTRTPSIEQMLADVDNTDTTLEYVSGYTNYSNKCHFKCSVCGHKVDVKPAILIYKGNGCSVCSAKRIADMQKYTKEDAQAVLDAKFDNNISIISYNGIEETGTFKCNTCNQQYKRVFSHQRGYTGNGCPYCLDKKPFTLNTHDALLAINKKFKGNITILSKEVNSNLDLCDFRCNTCGDVFKRVYGEEQRRKGNGCGNCERLAKLAKQFDKAKAMLNTKFNGNIIFIDTEYAGSHGQSHFKCLSCGTEFTKTYHAESALHGNGHPKCPNKTNQ